MKNDELLHKWVNGSITPEELAIFQKRPEYDSLTSLYKNTEGMSAPSFDEDSMLADILATEKPANNPKEGGKVFFLSSWVKYAAAAAILLASTWFLWPSFNGPENVVVEKAKHFEGQLPDGSTYVLNAESSLDFNGHSWGENREVSLKGEGFFTVKKGSTFTVLTPNGGVKVLGTQFNVRAREKSLEVICQSGKVAVLTADKVSLGELTQNEGVKIQGDSISQEWTIEANEKVSWIYGISKFNNAELSVVLDELARQYDIEVESEGIDLSQKITCNFQHKDLSQALKTTIGFLEINYDYQNKKLSLEK